MWGVLRALTVGNNEAGLEKLTAEQREKLEKFVSANERLEREKKNLEKHRDALQASRDSAQETVTSLQSEVHRSNKKNVLLKAEYDQTKLTVTEQKKDIEELTKCKERLERDKTAVETQRNALQSSWEEALQKIKALESDLAKERYQTSSLKEKCSSLSKERSDKSSWLEKDLEEKKTQNEDLSKKVSDLDHRLKSEENERHNKHVKNAKLEENNRHAESKIQQLTADLKAKEEKVFILEKEISALKGKLATTTTESEKLKEQIHALESKNGKQKQEIKDLSTENIVLKNKLESQQQKLSDVEVELSGLTMTAKERENKISELQAAKDQQSDDLTKNTEKSFNAMESMFCRNIDNTKDLTDKMFNQSKMHSDSRQSDMVNVFGLLHSAMDSSRRYQPQVEYGAPPVIGNRQQAPYTGMAFQGSYNQQGQQTPLAPQQFAYQDRPHYQQQPQGPPSWNQPYSPQQAPPFQGSPFDGSINNETSQRYPPSMYHSSTPIPDEQIPETKPGTDKQHSSVKE